MAHMWTWSSWACCELSMSKRKLVAIHQPNFFPWLGYFNKIARADVFIILDTVQFPKTGGSWLNRVQLVLDGERKWATMPINRSYHGVRTINEMQIADDGRWREKFLRSISINYRRAPFFDDVFPSLSELVNRREASLAAFNRAAIMSVLDRLELERGKIIDSSSLHAQGSGTDLLVELVRVVGGTSYLCGGGASGYQEDEKFAAAGLELVYQDYCHPVYPQAATHEFVAGLSIIDALMNCSWSGTRKLLDQAGTKS